MITLTALFWLIATPQIPDEFLDLGGDSAQYIILAESLSQGKGLRMVNYPGEPLSTFAPLISLLLSHIVFFFGRNFWLMHSLILLFSYLTLVVFYNLFKQIAPKTLARLTVIFLSANMLFWSYSLRILTEIPFLCLSGITFYFLVKYNNTKNTFNRDGFLAILTLATAYFCRYIGALIFLLGLLYLFLEKPAGTQNKTQFKKALFLSAVFLSVYTLWALRNANIQHPYSYQLNKQFFAVNGYLPHLGTIGPKELLARFLLGIDFYAQTAVNLLFPYFMHNLKSALLHNGLLVLAGIAITIGIWVKAEEKKYIFSLYSFIYLIIACLWPYREDGRYILPIVPFVLFYFLSGLKAIFNFLPKKFGGYSFLGLSFCLLAFNIFSLPKEKLSYKTLHQPYKNFISLHNWIKNNLPSNGLIISRKPTLTFFYTNHQSACYPFSFNPDELWQEAIKNNARYIIFDEFSKESFYYLLPFILKYENRLIFLCRAGKSGLFEIKK